jgi:disulfide oxidoreductase YuzD
LARTYNGQVGVTYYDAALPEVQAQFADVVQTAQSRYWPFPLVMINDRVVMAGDVNAYRISSLVDRELNDGGFASPGTEGA